MGKVLIACEYSGIVRDAFIAAGHDAISCDLLPTERPGPHIQGDVRELLCKPWDLVIAHPPCNYLSAYTWLFKNQERYANWWPRFWDAINLFWDCKEANAPLIAIENPHPNPPALRIMGPPGQVTGFQYFGDHASKRVCWWLKGLPPLMSTMHDPNAVAIVAHQTSAKLMPNGDRQAFKGLYNGDMAGRSKLRAQFHHGMAAAMAMQWGCFLPA